MWNPEQMATFTGTVGQTYALLPLSYNGIPQRGSWGMEANMRTLNFDTVPKRVIQGINRRHQENVYRFCKIYILEYVRAPMKLLQFYPLKLPLTLMFHTGNEGKLEGIVD